LNITQPDLGICRNYLHFC